MTDRQKGRLTGFCFYLPRVLLSQPPHTGLSLKMAAWGIKQSLHREARGGEQVGEGESQNKSHAMQTVKKKESRLLHFGFTAQPGPRPSSRLQEDPLRIRPARPSLPSSLPSSPAAGLLNHQWLSATRGCTQILHFLLSRHSRGRAAAALTRRRRREEASASRMIWFDLVKKAAQNIWKIFK